MSSCPLCGLSGSGPRAKRPRTVLVTSLGLGLSTSIKQEILKKWFWRCLSTLFRCDFEQMNSSSLCSSFLACLKGQPPDDCCALGYGTGRRMRRNGGDWTLSREWLWTDNTKAHMGSQSPTEHASLLKGMCSQNLSGPMCSPSQEAAYLTWMSRQPTSKGPSLQGLRQTNPTGYWPWGLLEMYLAWLLHSGAAPSNMVAPSYMWLLNLHFN